MFHVIVGSYDVIDHYFLNVKDKEDVIDSISKMLKFTIGSDVDIWIKEIPEAEVCTLLFSTRQDRENDPNPLEEFECLQSGHDDADWPVVGKKYNDYPE